MHFEILIEDSSGKKMLEVLMPKIISDQDTTTIHKFKGKGNYENIQIRDVLLNNLPNYLISYNKQFKSVKQDYMLVIIFDLDKDDLNFVKSYISGIIQKNAPDINVVFCLCIEEAEAWFLGDIDAIIRAYPRVDKKQLAKYQNDSICPNGTWEYLADAVYAGGAIKIKKNRNTGQIKHEWAEKITPFMNIQKNKSPSFNYFYNVITKYVTS